MERPSVAIRLVLPALQLFETRAGRVGASDHGEIGYFDLERGVPAAGVVVPVTRSAFLREHEDEHQA
jgi:hypothetical protein